MVVVVAAAAGGEVKGGDVDHRGEVDEILDQRLGDQPCAGDEGREHLEKEYLEWSGGTPWEVDFPEWEPVHQKLFSNGILGIENVGGDLDAVTGKRCTFAFFPWNWDRGDGCIIRLVAMIDKGQQYRIEPGETF